MHALWGWRFTADVFNEPQSDTDSMRLRREIQFPAQVFSDLPQHPREFFILTPSRKANSGIPIVQQRVDLATNEFPLPRALRLLALHVPLQSPLLGTHQIMV
jgi:hypothetical protein